MKMSCTIIWWSLVIIANSGDLEDITKSYKSKAWQYKNTFSYQLIGVCKYQNHLKPIISHKLQYSNTWRYV